MANIKSQIKRIKQNEKRHERNKAVKSALKSAIRKFREAAEAGEKDQAIELGLGTDEAWLILAHWVNMRSDTSTDAAITASLNPYLDAIDATLLTRCMKRFDRMLRAEADDRSSRLRARRLWRALTGSFT